jgi:hypothetical protein
VTKRHPDDASTVMFPPCHTPGERNHGETVSFWFRSAMAYEAVVLPQMQPPGPPQFSRSKHPQSSLAMAGGMQADWLR